MDETDETAVKTRHKRKLTEIRGKDNGIGESSNVVSGGYSEAPGVSVRRAQEPAQGIEGSAGGGTQGTEGDARAAGGYGEGIRQIVSTPIAPTEGINRSDQPIGEGQLIADLTPEEKAERERELARQRKQRQRDRERDMQRDTDSVYDLLGTDGDLSTNRDRDRDFSNAEGVTQASRDGHDVTQASRFRLRNPLKKEAEKVKLFSKTEAEEAKENLTYIYLRGSGLIDDLLEIIVKGHEKVSIWQLSAGEADMLAEMHLEKARTDQEAARSARALLAIYDRLFTIMLLGPRMIRTMGHVREHGGLSFK